MADKEYGVLVYDVPSSEKSFYSALRTRIWGKAIPINKSVYLIPYGNKPTIERMVESAKKFAEKKALEKGLTFNPAGINVDIIKFDGSSQDEIERILRREVARLFEDLRTRIGKKISELKIKGKEFEESKQKYYHKRLDNLVTSAFLFGLSSEIEDAVKTIRQIINLEQVVLA